MTRIVVVEDDDVTREFVVRCLSARGFDVVAAADGEAGLELVRMCPASVLLTDIRMSGMDGFALANAVRCDVEISQPDIIFMSSNEEREMYRRALQLGGCDFLVKPFTCAEIVHAISARVMRQPLAKSIEAVKRPDEAVDARFPNINGYRLIQRLGEGNTSQVYLASPVNSSELHAIKLLRLPRDMAERQEEISRFLTEYAILAKLSHPNVARVYAHGINSENFYLALEYLPGGDLRLDIQAGMGPAAVVRRATEIASALQAIHAAGVVHRDLKPANVLMRMTGQAVLVDFGIAKLAVSGLPVTQSKMTVGTPYYMSPEQATGHSVDARSDQYSLGIVIYEMLTGYTPFRSMTAAEVLAQHVTAAIPRLPEVAAAFQPLIDRLLAKKPEGRFADDQAVLEAILSITI